METIFGKALHIQHRTEFLDNKKREIASHICSFVVGREHVELKVAAEPAISNGDRVYLAGKRKADIFHAQACKNISTGWLSPEPRMANFWAFSTFIMSLGIAAWLLVFALIVVILKAVGMQVLYACFVGLTSLLIPYGTVKFLFTMYRRVTYNQRCWQKVRDH